MTDADWIRADRTKLIAENLHSLPGEDGRPTRLMHFSQFGKDEKAKAATHLLATTIAEGIQRLEGRAGFLTRHRDDVDPADTADNYKKVQFKCVNCGTFLFDLGCNNQLIARISPLAIKSLLQMSHECRP